MKWFLIFIATIALASCKRDEVGEYFYKSGLTIHLSKDCEGDEYIKSSDVYRGANYGFCSRCISDEQMKQIEDSINKYHAHE